MRLHKSRNTSFPSPARNSEYEIYTVIAGRLGA